MHTHTHTYAYSHTHSQSLIKKKKVKQLRVTALKIICKMPRAGLNFNLIADPEDNFHNNIPMPRCATVKTEKNLSMLTLNTKISLSIQ